MARTLDVAIPGVDFDGNRADDWPNFGRVAAFNDVPVGKPPPGLEDRLLRIVEHSTGVGREHALWRLTALHKAKRLTGKGRARLARSLWGPDGSLPNDPAGLWMPHLLHLPEIELGQAERMIRSHFLSGPDVALSRGDLQNLAFVTGWPVQIGDHERGVLWSASEALTLLGRIERWVKEGEAESERDQRFGANSDTLSQAKRNPHVSQALGSSVMSSLDPGESAAWDRVDATLASLAAAAIPIGRAIPFLLRDGRPVEKVAQAMRRELASSDRLRFSEASWGISSWARWAKENSLPMPPPHLLDEIIYGVSVGRPGNLEAGHALAGLLKDLPGVLEPRQQERLADALGSALAQVALPTPHDALSLPPAGINNEIDERTLVGARLAAALDVSM